MCGLKSSKIGSVVVLGSLCRCYFRSECPEWLAWAYHSLIPSLHQCCLWTAPGWLFSHHDFAVEERCQPAVTYHCSHCQCFLSSFCRLLIWKSLRRQQFSRFGRRDVFSADLGLDYHCHSLRVPALQSSYLVSLDVSDDVQFKKQPS